MNETMKKAKLKSLGDRPHFALLLRAEGIERNETDIFSWVRQGDTISEIIDKGGYF